MALVDDLMRVIHEHAIVLGERVPYDDEMNIR